MKNLKQLYDNPVIHKPFHTFYQAAIPVFLAGWLNVAHAFQNGGLAAGKAAGLALLIAIGAAGISAVKTAWVEAHRTS